MTCVPSEDSDHSGLGWGPGWSLDARVILSFCGLFVFQEKTVALKIYELGLKKFGHITEYIMSYIDFMSHLNGMSDHFLFIWLYVMFGIKSKVFMKNNNKSFE